MLKKIPLAGGVPVPLAPADGNYGASWTADDRIVFATPEGVYRVSADGGAVEPLIATKLPEAIHGPRMLPDGEHLLMTVTTALGAGRWDKGQIITQSLSTGERRTLLEPGRDARYIATGHLVYAVGDTLFAVRFNASTLQVLGTPVSMERGIRGSNGTNTGAAFFAVSETGHLASVPVPDTPLTNLAAFVDVNGRVASLPYELPQQMSRFSPDGSHFAVSDGGVVWIHPANGKGVPRRLTLEGFNASPIWTQDGARVTYRQIGTGILTHPADGNGAVEVLLPDGAAQTGSPVAWSRDGTTLFFYASSKLWSWRRGEQPRQIDVPEGLQQDQSLSPNGEWIALWAPEGNRAVSYIQSISNPAVRYQISREGGHHPLWAPDGRRLFYVADRSDRLMVVDVQTEPSVTFGEPRTVIDGIVQILNSDRYYDITPDGTRLLAQLLQDRGDPRAREIDVVLNWTEELKRRVPMN